MVWLAELGKPQTAMIYSTMCNSLDVRESAVGVGVHLKWWFTEKELALYDSKHLDSLPLPARSYIARANMVQTGLPISTGIPHAMGLTPPPVFQVLTATTPTGWRSVP